MSILLKQQIKEEQSKGVIVIEPFNPQQLGPNSYDVRLSPTLKVYSFEDSPYLDCKSCNKTMNIIIPPEGFILQPNVLYLGTTEEKVGSDFYVTMYDGRSSMARLGILSHLSAGFGDIGFKTNWTLEITVVHPTKIYPHMTIGQMFFQKIDPNYNAAENRYNGKYQNQIEAQESLSHLDFNK